MANRRVTELNELTTEQLAVNDLFLVSDVSAVESKRIRASELRDYALQGTCSWANSSATSSWADNSGTASFLLYQGWFNGSASYAISTSYALSASYADWAKSASYVVSASYALSSSWAFRCVTASYAETSSLYLVISSGFADRSRLADSASYLIYTTGFNNGTSSAAISSSWARQAATASFLAYNGTPNGSASYALSSSTARSSSYAITSSHLVYNGIFNGSASYAVVSETAYKATYTAKPMIWDLFTPTVTDISESRITTMSINRPYDGDGWSYTFVTFHTNVILSYTSSATSSIQLVAHNQATNYDYLLDKVPLYFSAGGGALVTGSIHIPVTLEGADLLENGNYYLYVTASNRDISIDTTRPARFKIESQAQEIIQLV